MDYGIYLIAFTAIINYLVGRYAIKSGTKNNSLALIATGKPVVMVLFNGRPLALPLENALVPAILEVWFSGTEAGNAIADVLFGKVNPSGKLTATFPQNVGQIPIYYSTKNTGRPLPQEAWFMKFRSNYLDVSNEPVYPFGYGLSYTTFSFSNLRLEKSTINSAESVKVFIDVKFLPKVQKYTLRVRMQKSILEYKIMQSIWIFQWL